jgi:hypothetical protein
VTWMTWPTVAIWDERVRVGVTSNEVTAASGTAAPSRTEIEWAPPEVVGTVRLHSNTPADDVRACADGQANGKESQARENVDSGRYPQPTTVTILPGTPEAGEIARLGLSFATGAEITVWAGAEIPATAGPAAEVV